MKHVQKKSFLTLIMILLVTLILSACAQGEAHVTVHTDGTADVKLNLTIQNQELKLIGQSAIIEGIQNTLEEQGYITQTNTTEDTSEITATKEIVLNQSVQKFDFPESISYSNVSQDHFLYTKHVITVDADLLSSDSETGQTSDLLQKIPSIVRNILLKDVKLDFKLTLPIQPDSSNADAVSADGKTLTWNVDLLSANHLELSVKIPNITNIIIIAVIALLLVAVIVWYVLRKRKTRRK